MAIQQKTAAALLLCFATACSDAGHDETNATQPSGVDLFIYGGPIYTGIDDSPKVEAIAVKGGRVLITGGYTEIAALAGDGVKTIDLKGAALYPGFTDAHAHLLGIGMRELTLNLEGIASLEQLLSIVTANMEHLGEGDTLYGRGWIETGWPEGRMPTRDDIDPVSGDNPVILRRADGHALVANSAALSAAGIDDATPDPEGGRIERDTAGRATGILIDNAQSLVADLIGAPNESRKKEAFGKASDIYSAYGWTGMHNMSVNPDNVAMIEALSTDGGIDIRVYNSVDAAGLAALEEYGPRVSDNGHIITRAIKLYVDGALGSRGAALSEPYSDHPDTNGLLVMQKDQALALFERALPSGIQVNTHAIGDRGNKLILDWYEEALSHHSDIKDPRWRIEHSQILHTEDIPRFATLGVIPSMQPSHAIGDLFFAPDRLGPNRLDGAYAWRALIDAGSIIPGGSDAPVERGDPRIEFYAAVARRGLNGYQDKDWRPAQAVTRTEALKMFTLWPAYASFQEDDLGTIEPGKRADFTVFSKDIMTIPEADILDVEAVMTIVDGDIVYRASE